MSVVNTKHLSLLGKKVSFVSGGEFLFDTLGTVSSVVFNLDGSFEFLIDTCNAYFSFDDVIEFQILD